MRQAPVTPRVNVSAGELSRIDFLSLLYSSHYGWLFAWLRKKLGCPHHAADLAQEAFTRVIALPDPAELREPRAYLLVTVNHLLLNQRKRSQIEQETLHTVAILAEDGDAHSPEHLLTLRQLLRSVMQALLDELDEKPRRAFLFARLEGLGYREIAAKLKVSESSVKQYLAKALCHCHARLHAWEGIRIGPEALNA